MLASSQTICTQQNIARRHFSLNECSSRASCSLQVFASSCDACTRKNLRARASYSGARASYSGARASYSGARASYSGALP